MNWLLLVASIAICELIGVAGTVFTFRAIPTWYAHLRKPGFNPPSWVFGPAWTILYALQGIAVYLVLHETGNETAITIFIIQLILNGFWTPIFFGAKKIGVALAEIIVLLIFIIATAALFFIVNQIAGWLMIPYAAWVAFATTLNYSLWRLNRN